MLWLRAPLSTFPLRRLSEEAIVTKTTARDELTRVTQKDYSWYNRLTAHLSLKLASLPARSLEPHGMRCLLPRCRLRPTVPLDIPYLVFCFCACAMRVACQRHFCVPECMLICSDHAKAYRERSQPGADQHGGPRSMTQMMSLNMYNVLQFVYAEYRTQLVESTLRIVRVKAGGFSQVRVSSTSDP